MLIADMFRQISDDFAKNLNIKIVKNLYNNKKKKRQSPDGYQKGGLNLKVCLELDPQTFT
jgi:hypothetical protein